MAEAQAEAEQLDAEDDVDEERELEAEIEAAIGRGVSRERVQAELDAALVDTPEQTQFSMLIATVKLRNLGRRPSDNPTSD